MSVRPFLRSVREWVQKSRRKRAASRPSVRPQVECLEGRLVPAVTATLDWSMQERFGQTSGEFIQTAPDQGVVVPFLNSRINIHNNPTFVQAKSFTVQLDGQRSSGDTPITSYAWTVRGDNLASPVSLGGSRPTVSLPEGFYYVTLTVAGNGQTNSTTSAIEVNDILVVAIGDSEISGEGNPDIPRSGDNIALWGDGPNAAYAHRSSKAFSARAALELERSDPHTSVTYVSVAASGDQITNGLLNPAEDWQGLEDVRPTRGQIDQVRDIVGGRRIDALCMAIGANDLHWSARIPKLLTAPTFNVKEDARAGFTDSHGNQVPDVRTLVNDLPNRYAQLDQAIKAKLNVADVYISEYHDPTHTSPTTFVDHALNDIVPGLEIDTTEAKFCFDEFVVPLNNAVRAAASKHNWHLVGGIQEGFINHGYTAADHWVVTANESRNTQGPFTELSFWEKAAAVAAGTLAAGLPGGVAALFGTLGADEAAAHLDRMNTKGTLHPNAPGQQFMAQRLLETIRSTRDFGKKDRPYNADDVANVYLFPFRITHDVTIRATEPRTANDRFTVRQSPHHPDFTEVRVNDRTIYTGYTPRLEDLIIRGGDGSEIFDIESAPRNVTLTVYAGGGHDTFRIGRAGSMSTIQGPMSLHGESGTNSVTFNDALNTRNSTWTMTTPPTDGGVASLQRTGDGAMTFRQMANVTLNSGSGTDTLNIQRTLYGSRTNVYAGGGTDTINVGSSNVMDWIRPLLIDGQAGADTVNFNDHGAGRSRTYTMTTPPTDGGVASLQMSTPTGVLLDPITYRGTETVTLNTGSAGDVLAIQRTLYGSSTRVNAGDGVDVINVGSSNVMDWIRPLSIDGQGGGDILRFNDQGAGRSRTYAIDRSAADAALGFLRMTTPTGAVLDPVDFRAESVLLNSGSAADNITIAAVPSISTINVNAGGGDDTLTGGNVANTWTITDPNAGNINGNTIFSGVENLRGGSAADQFRLLNGRSISGTIDGAGGSDMLEYAGWLTPVQLSVSAVFWATATGTGVSFLTGVESVIGGLMSDTLTSTSFTGNLWNLTGTNAGNVGGMLNFSSFENLTGTAQDDTFTVGVAGGLSGRIDAGGGTDLIDYSAWTTAIRADLQLGVGTRITNGISNFENAVGGSAGDTLFGDARNNVLRGGGGNDSIYGIGGNDLLLGEAGDDSLSGGAGRDFLIGGIGADRLITEEEEDLLIGGTTSYDANTFLNRLSLQTIMNEWTSGRSYESRVANIRGTTPEPVRANGTNYLRTSGTGVTVFDDGAIDSLNGGLGRDWFFAFGVDVRDAGQFEEVN